ncbi:OmpA/MotB domain-containing protein [Candidatus Magnetobacterium bavaricum]|uniref:OmpA/MotB domain-containing protein n=1 Tax=Candidatus Magnetobacterium bavaricum TaxID=29290 RepID=A0A0F3GJR6_9BACT|nr:OmpA/MotB domain-containing protein [Candidatus Magnetobacterium bavaricum]
MMKIRSLVVLLSIFVVLVSCAKEVKKEEVKPVKNAAIFTLLSDDGEVGSIEVSNSNGVQEINKADNFTGVRDVNTAPSQPQQMQPQQIQEIFGAALNAIPPPPEKFMLHFKRDLAELTQESAALLPKVIETIRRLQSVDISVIGHTDTSGSREHNYKLSLKRAQGVSKYLIEHGVEPENLEIESHGKDNPLIPTADNVDEPRNRRVEITIR